MVIIPNSDIILLKCPLEIDEINQLTFSNATAQYNYFNSLPKIECSNATYQRKDEVVRFPTDPSLEGVTYDDLIQYNYCMYKNTAWDDKWFYAYIRSITFDNPGMSLIELETDVFQTWQFDITWKRCFVEREHVNNDTVGLHTVPENVETGEYIVDSVTKKLGFDYNNCSFILATTIFPYVTQDSDGNWILSGGRSAHCNVYNSVLSGLEYFWYSNTASGISQLQHVIEAFDRAGQSDYIYMLFIAPNDSFEKVLEETNIGYWGSVKQKQGAYDITWGSNSTPLINKPTSLNGYTPINKKLLTYPYCYLLMNNGNGGNAIYHYELFMDTYAPTKCEFLINSAICPGTSMILRPIYYKNNGLNYNQMDSLPGGKFPMCSWNSDAYINWLTQNSVNIQMGLARDVLNVGTSVATKDIKGGLQSGLSLISDILGIKKEQEILSEQAKGDLNTGDVNFSNNETTFTAYQMSIKEEYARIIDGYFSMYGYQVNSLKVPNITGRTNWNYVKTVGCNIIGNIPQQDIIKIKDMFNNGVTLWHNPSTFLDYSQSNNIV